MWPGRSRRRRFTRIPSGSAARLAAGVFQALSPAAGCLSSRRSSAFSVS